MPLGYALLPLLLSANTTTLELISNASKGIKEPKFDSVRQFAYTLYFFGLRFCEVDEETHIQGDFLIERNRKRKNGIFLHIYAKTPVDGGQRWIRTQNHLLNPFILKIPRTLSHRCPKYIYVELKIVNIPFHCLI